MFNAWIKNKRNFIIAVSIFCLIQLILYLLSHLPMVPGSKFINYTMLLVALAFTALFASKSKKGLLMLIAIVCTLIADIFLVIMVDYIAIGMLFFCVTQLVYAKITLDMANNKKEKYLNICLRFLIIIVLEIVCILVIGDTLNALVTISVFYIVNILINTIFAFIHLRKNASFAIGLLFFLICDLIIMFLQINGYVNLNVNFLTNMANSVNLSWIFYPISQVLLAISSVKDHI